MTKFRRSFIAFFKLTAYLFFVSYFHNRISYEENQVTFVAYYALILLFAADAINSLVVHFTNKTKQK